MIKVYYAKINDEWKDQELEEKISCLPLKMVEQVMKYRNWQDRQLSIAGKLLLLNSLKDFNLSERLTLKDLMYTEFGRPYYNQAFDFNISHTKNIAVCATTPTGKVGIDIEKIKPITIEDLKEYFTVDEMEAINISSDKNISFYKTWTKKEAFIKAVGKGLNIDLSLADTMKNVVANEGKLYYLYEVTIENAYACCVCSTGKEDVITTTEILL
jgi:4'-phosphopantetheinyl transferase